MTIYISADLARISTRHDYIRLNMQRISSHVARALIRITQELENDSVKCVVQDTETLKNLNKLFNTEFATSNKQVELSSGDAVIIMKSDELWMINVLEAE